MARTVYERADVVPLIAEVFRDLGYEGTTISQITERTGLGKGSLYHFFPGGKDEMAAAVLDEIDQWFERHIYEPLRNGEPKAAIASMWKSTDAYFRSGGRICLVGAFALDSTRDRFSLAIADYFRRWIRALEKALIKSGRSRSAAARGAEEAVSGIQGALVLARALNDPALFSRIMKSLSERLEAPATSASNRISGRRTLG